VRRDAVMPASDDEEAEEETKSHSQLNRSRLDIVLQRHRVIRSTDDGKVAV
jgi:hypothetical protein